MSDEVQVLAVDEIEEWVAFLKETTPRPGSSDHEITLSRAPFERIIASLEHLQAERDEARYQARCFANRMREYGRHGLTDLNKELIAGEEACPWLKEPKP